MGARQHRRGLPALSRRRACGAGAAAASEVSGQDIFFMFLMSCMYISSKDLYNLLCTG